MPMQVYAAGFDSSSRRPRVGLLLAGIGLDQAESEAAIRALPGGVTLAISPYARNRRNCWVLHGAPNTSICCRSRWSRRDFR